MERLQSNKFFLAALLLAIAGAAVVTLPMAAGAEESATYTVSPEGPGGGFVPDAGSGPSAPGLGSSVTSGPGSAVTPDINTYLKNLYFWFLGVVGISALFAITFGGVLYMFSGTSLTKVDQARKWISNGIFGILLAGGSYVLLKAINPDFTEHGFDLTNSINRLLPPPVRSTSAPAAAPNNPASPGVGQPVMGNTLEY